MMCLGFCYFFASILELSRGLLCLSLIFQCSLFASIKKSLFLWPGFSFAWNQKVLLLKFLDFLSSKKRFLTVLS